MHILSGKSVAMVMAVVSWKLPEWRARGLFEDGASHGRERGTCGEGWAQAGGPGAAPLSGHGHPAFQSPWRSRSLMPGDTFEIVSPPSECLELPGLLVG